MIFRRSRLRSRRSAPVNVAEDVNPGGPHRPGAGLHDRILSEIIPQASVSSRSPREAMEADHLLGAGLQVSQVLGESASTWLGDVGVLNYDHWVYC